MCLTTAELQTASRQEDEQPCAPVPGILPLVAFSIYFLFRNHRGQIVCLLLEKTDKTGCQKIK